MKISEKIKKILMFSALGVGVVAFIVLLVGGVGNTMIAITENDLSDIVLVDGNALLIEIVSGIMLILASVIAIVGTGFMLRRSLVPIILLGVAAILSGISMILFNAFGLTAMLLLLAATALMVFSHRKWFNKTQSSTENTEFPEKKEEEATNADATEVI